MKKGVKKFFCILVCLISILATSFIGLAQTNAPNAMVCDSCGQNTVILQKDYFSTSNLVEHELAGSNSQFCNYCDTTRKFNHYDVYSRKYDYYNYWHECINCGWHSSGWPGKVFVSEVKLRSYDECTVCGMEK